MSRPRLAIFCFFYSFTHVLFHAGSQARSNLTLNLDLMLTGTCYKTSNSREVNIQSFHTLRPSALSIFPCTPLHLFIRFITFSMIAAISLVVIPVNCSLSTPEHKYSTDIANAPRPIQAPDRVTLDGGRDQALLGFSTPYSTS